MVAVPSGERATALPPLFLCSPICLLSSTRPPRPLARCRALARLLRLAGQHHPVPSLPARPRVAQAGCSPPSHALRSHSCRGHPPRATGRSTSPLGGGWPSRLGSQRIPHVLARSEAKASARFARSLDLAAGAGPGSACEPGLARPADVRALGEAAPVDKELVVSTNTSINSGPVVYPRGQRRSGPR